MIRDKASTALKATPAREYLNLWESLAVGIETGVYEIEITDALIGALGGDRRELQAVHRLVARRD